LPVPSIPTVVLEVSALKGQEQSTGCALAVSPPAIPMTEDRSTIHLILIGPLEIRAVLTRSVGQAASALNLAEVFTERVSGNVSLACGRTGT
jgi:hypothetical protein